MIIGKLLRGAVSNDAIRCRAQSRRWASYDKKALSLEALEAKVQAGLRNSPNQNFAVVDTGRKKIVTAGGDLPMSPLFNPQWIKARRRQRKDDPREATGRFREKLAKNIYARALATSIRRCATTFVSLPRYFLQDFEIVKCPSNDSVWWAPGHSAFEHLEKFQSSSASTISRTLEHADANAQPSHNGQNPDKQSTKANSHDPRQRSPVTIYTLCQKQVVDRIGGKNPRFLALLLANRGGLAVTPNHRNAVWRSDMGEVLLEMLRSHAADALLFVSKLGDRSLIRAAGNWDDVKDAPQLGCVLWLPSKEEASRQYATLDNQGAKYGKKVTVHNLEWLLGASEVQRLKAASTVIRDNEILILRNRRSRPTRQLHLLLWKLQGYLAQLH